MGDILELMFIVLVMVCFYGFAAWTTIKSLLLTLEGRNRYVKTLPFLLAEAAFFGTTIWGIIAIIYGDGYSDNPAAPFPPIALLSSVCALSMWSIVTAIIFVSNLFIQAQNEDES